MLTLSILYLYTNGMSLLLHFSELQYNIMYSAEKCSYKLIENMSVAKRESLCTRLAFNYFCSFKQYKFLSTTDLI